MPHPETSPEADAAAASIRSASYERSRTLVELRRTPGRTFHVPVPTTFDDVCSWCYHSRRMDLVLVEKEDVDAFLGALEPRWHWVVHSGMVECRFQLPEGPGRSALALSKVAGWLAEEQADVPILKTSGSQLWMVVGEAMINPLNRWLVEQWSNSPLRRT